MRFIRSVCYFSIGNVFEGYENKDRNFFFQCDPERQVCTQLPTGTGTIESGENRFGEPRCQYAFYQDWVKDPEAMQQRVEGFTRKKPGVESAPIKGIPFK